MRNTNANLFQHWDLISSFAMRDIKARYKQTALGVAWALLQPLSMMVVFTLVFSLFAKVPSDGIPYPVFAYSALIFWIYFSNTISSGTTAMVANAPLIRKIYFPRETLLIAVVLGGLLDLGVASILFAGLLVYYKVALSLAALWVIPLLLLQTALIFGVISLTAAANVYYRDMGHALPLVVQLWMFATPVAQGLALVPKWGTSPNSATTGWFGSAALKALYRLRISAAPIGLPISSVISSARSSIRSRISSKPRRRISPRWRGGMAAKESWWATAASRARIR